MSLIETVFFRIAWASLVTLSSIAVGQGGNTVGGNGDAVSGWLVATASLVVEKVDEGKRTGASWAGPIDAVALKAALKTVIVLVDDQNRKGLEDRFGRIGDAKVAFEAGADGRPLILLERETWTNFWRNNAAEPRVVLHLYLQASRHNDTHYRISAKVPFATAKGAGENAVPQKTVWTKHGVYSWPVPRGAGFAVIHANSLPGERIVGDSVEAYAADGTLQWKLEPTYDAATPAEEVVQLTLAGLSPTKDGGLFSVGEMRAGNCQRPFVIKISPDGRQEWIQHVVSPGIERDCWERVYDNPIAIAAETSQSALLLFDRRVVRVERQHVTDLTDELSGFVSSYDVSSPFRFRDVLLLGDSEILLLGGLEIGTDVFPFVKRIDRHLHETWSKTLEDLPSSFFFVGSSMSDSRFFLVCSTIDPKAGHLNYRQILFGYEATGNRLTRELPLRWKRSTTHESGPTSDFVTAIGRGPSGSAILVGSTSHYEDRANPSVPLHQVTLSRNPSPQDEVWIRQHEVFRAGALALIGPNGAVQTELSFPGVSVEGFLPLSAERLLLVQGTGLKIIRSPFP